jgi:hypothetical protein
MKPEGTSTRRACCAAGISLDRVGEQALADWKSDVVLAIGSGCLSPDGL